jgi:hypothetical protein
VLCGFGVHRSLAQLAPEEMSEAQRFLLSFSDGRQQAVPSSVFLEEASLVLSLPDAVRDIAEETKAKMDRCELVAMLVPPGASVDLSLKRLYDEDCLTRPDQLPDVTRDALDRTTLIMRRYTDISGKRLGPEYYCAAVRVSASVAVTARHCISGYVDTITGLINFDAMRSNVELLHPADINTVYTIDDYHNNSYYSTSSSGGGAHSSINPKNDYIFLKLVPDAEEPPLRIVQNADISPLILYGPHLFPLEIEISAGQTDIDKAMLQSLRWDEQGSCFGVPSPDGCIFHGCQTEQMNSGAGLFLRGVDDRLVVIGIHLSTARNAVPPFAAEGCSLPHKPLARKIHEELAGADQAVEIV